MQTTAVLALPACLWHRCSSNDMWVLFKASGVVFSRVKQWGGYWWVSSAETPADSCSHDVRLAGLEEKAPFFVWGIIKARLSTASDDVFVPVAVWFCQSTGGVYVEWKTEWNVLVFFFLFSFCQRAPKKYQKKNNLGNFPNYSQGEDEDKLVLNDNVWFYKARGRAGGKAFGQHVKLRIFF